MNFLQGDGDSESEDQDKGEDEEEEEEESAGISRSDDDDDSTEEEEEPMSEAQMKKARVKQARKIKKEQLRNAEKRAKEKKKQAQRDEPEVFLGRQKVPTYIKDQLLIAVPAPPKGKTYPDPKIWKNLLDDPQSTLSSLVDKMMRRFPERSLDTIKNQLKSSFRTHYKKVRILQGYVLSIRLFWMLSDS